MAYTASSFTALEQPTLTKWNYLWDNDAYFYGQVGTNFSSGTTSKVWFEELGRTTLGGSADTISVSSFAARKFLRIIITLIATGGTITHGIRFNSDSGANYSFGRNLDGAAISTGVSQTSIEPFASKSFPVYTTIDVINITAQEKLLMGQSLCQNTAGAGNVIQTSEIYAKWANTAAQITTATLNNGGTGDFASGSSMVILGHD